MILLLQAGNAVNFFGYGFVAGAGTGLVGTANQTLLITLITPEQRPTSFALGRVTQNLGLGIDATVAGFIVASAQHLLSFRTLYLVDAITYAALALLLLAMAPNPRARRRTLAPWDEDSGRSPAIASS